MQVHKRLERRPKRDTRGARCVRPGVIAPIVIAFGLLFGQLLQLSHLLLVPHRACEHGELIHTEGGESSSPLARPSPASPHGPRAVSQSGKTEHDTRLDRASAEEQGEHDHCDVNALRHRAGELGPSLGEASLLHRIAARALPPLPERRPIALLCVAPKSSPPRG